MNIVVAIKDHQELDRVTRPLAAAGHTLTPVHRYPTLLRALAAVRADAAVIEWRFDGVNDEALVKNVRGPSGDGPAVVMLLPERWPTEAANAFAWGAQDVVRRPVCAPELAVRLERWARQTHAVAEPPASALADLYRQPFWRELDDIMAGELSATIGVPLHCVAGDAATPLVSSALSRLTLAAEGCQVVVGVGVHAGAEAPLAARLLGAPAGPELMGDMIAELTNVAAGAVKRAAYGAGKVFSLGLPRVQPAGRLPLERHWRLEGEGLVLHGVAAARSTRPEVVLCGDLREGMVVTRNVLGDNGVLLAARGTCLSERSVERLRTMLGDRYTIEVSLPDVGE